MRSDTQPIPYNTPVTSLPQLPQTPADEAWFSKYNFRRPLGRGGMGTVYLAEQRHNHNHPCVVKQMSAEFNNLAEQNKAIRLFKREAEILSALHHPGIVPILDVYVTDDNRYFLVMDYIPGTNLNVVLKTAGALQQDLAVALMIQCLEILEYLHSQTPPIIYRDLKPSNIMLTPQGRIVLIDFGIARLLMPQQAATRVVSEGYSPPEQYAGRPEPASDLYALGCTLSYLLTGVHPKPLSTCVPAQLNTVVLPALNDLCRRLTAADPRDRPGSAREVRRALYKIYAQASPETEIPIELLKNDPTPLRKPVQSRRLTDERSAPAHSLSAALHTVLQAQQYFRQIRQKKHSA